ncbi:hypothetical protein EVAR_37136_1 [Eumeta japonica]|uniref:Uncharacterized protein n=1 Tax=Eumeta variegata TaxID=151549 RepID=A0A4C1XSY0_EUMVA|nr:hypothetical protein EVAR_37136_1 [Eumeta japonica]
MIEVEEEEGTIVRNRDLMAIASTSMTNILECTEDSDEEQILNSELSLPKVPCSEKALKRDGKNLVTPKLVAALDRCQLSIRDSVYILHAFVEALDIVTVYWDGKLLPGLDVRSSKEERLPIIATFDDREQLLAVPKLESSSGKHRTKTVSNALFDWNLHEKLQIMCCDTTASKTGRFNGACAILEQSLQKELLLFACRHHV